MIRAGRLLLLWLFLQCAGCGGNAEPSAEPQPRPVSFVELSEITQDQSMVVTGIVGSWKTEEIGFEVPGRVDWVIEPDRDVEIDLRGPDNAVVREGTQLARLIEDRYELAVESAQAKVDIAKRLQEATQIDIDRTIPAQIDSAKAEVKLAQAEQTRTKNLVDRNAATQADLDQADAKLNKAEASLAQLQATLEAKRAELQSRAAEVRQAQQVLKEAKRDLADCTLNSSFRGQVAEVHVVPGSVVDAGTPVATVQMMDPIKVEVQLSAARSRTLDYRDVVPVQFIGTDGQSRTVDAMVYMTDTAADPETRTFKLTLLVRNRKLKTALPTEVSPDDVLRAGDVWRVYFDFLPGAEPNQLYVEQRCVFQGEDGPFVLRVDNRKVGDPITDKNRVMQVTPVPISLGKHTVPFLGNWTFQEMTPKDPDSLNKDTDLVVGGLLGEVPAEQIRSTPQVVLDQSRWMLRPGDLVRVNLNAKSTEAGGLLVPAEAVLKKSGKLYVCAVEGELGETASANMIAVQPVNDSPIGSVVQIQPHDSLGPNSKIVVGGVHFLRDGEPLRLQEKAIR